MNPLAPKKYIERDCQDKTVSGYISLQIIKNVLCNERIQNVKHI